MKKHRFDADILDKDILVKRLQDSVDEVSYEYHESLIKLIQLRINDDKTANDEDFRLRQQLKDNFSKVVSLQNSIIRESMELAKQTLERAFDLSGLSKELLSKGLEEK